MKQNFFFLTMIFNLLVFFPLQAAEEIGKDGENIQINGAIIMPQCFNEYWLDSRKNIIDLELCEQMVQQDGGDSAGYKYIGKLSNSLVFELSHYTGSLWNKIVLADYLQKSVVHKKGALKIIADRAEGTLCNMGYSDVAVKNDQLYYIRYYTFADLLYLLQQDIDAGLYAKLENRPKRCVAKARHTYDFKNKKEQTFAVYLIDDWIKEDYRKNIFEPNNAPEQICLENQLKDFIASNGIELDEEKLHKLGLVLERQCGSNFM
ncbi:MAG: hypothetical protein AB7G80_05170 [Dongiaceae bacterium]